MKPSQDFYIQIYFTKENLLLFTHLFPPKTYSVSLIWLCKWNIMHAVLHYSQIPSCTSNTHNSIWSH